MPIERRDNTTQIRSILLALVALVFAVTLGYAVFRAATGQRSTVTKGANDGLFNAGDASALAKQEAEGGPILLSDVSGNGQNRPLYLIHLGKDVEKGWTAVEARPPGAPSDCFLKWDRSKERFSAPCTKETFNESAEGLTTLPLNVSKDGALVIDVRPEDK